MPATSWTRFWMLDLTDNFAIKTAGLLKGEYGATPAPVNAELRARVLEGAEPLTCRPADRLEPEMEKETAELTRIAAGKGIRLADAVVDDVLTYALFPQIGLRFLENRDNPDAFEPLPDAETPAPVAAAAQGAAIYAVRVNGKSFTVEVAEGGQLSHVKPAQSGPAAAPGDVVKAVLAGNIFKIHVSPGDTVAAGDPLFVVEAMKMETVVSAPKAGVVTDVFIAEGDSVAVGDPLVAIA